jgi:hypothetical protein
MCCEVLPQYTYVLRAYLTVKTYVLRGVLKRQTRWHVHRCIKIASPRPPRAPGAPSGLLAQTDTIVARP